MFALEGGVVNPAELEIVGPLGVFEGGAFGDFKTELAAEEGGCGGGDFKAEAASSFFRIALFMEVEIVSAEEGGKCHIDGGVK